jgi:hypothetical protein
MNAQVHAVKRRRRGNAADFASKRQAAPMELTGRF